MHSLEVIVARNMAAAARECAHAYIGRNHHLAQEIANATPGAVIESEFHQEFRRVVQQEG